MTTSLTAYIEAERALTPRERLEAARQLRLSVDQNVESSQDDIDTAWQDETNRRIDTIENGIVELVDADETYRLLSDELAARGQ